MLCDNFDSAATLLISHTAGTVAGRRGAGEAGNPGRPGYAGNAGNAGNAGELSELGKQIDAFVEKAEKSAKNDLSQQNRFVLSILKDVITLFLSIDANQMEKALEVLQHIPLLPNSCEILEIRKSVANLAGVPNCVLSLIPEVLLSACTCICYYYNQFKAQYVCVSEIVNCSMWLWTTRKSEEFRSG